MDDGGWRGTLYELAPDQSRGAPVAASDAVVRRVPDGVEYEVRTTGVRQGNSYTLWLMAFNNPAACRGEGAPAGFRCGPGDMGNADTGFGLVYGGGGWADSDAITLTGRRAANDPSGVELGTAGLTNARDAEIHLRVRDHGPAQSGLENAQAGTLMGGCTDDSPPGAGTGDRGSYQCRDVQATGM